MWLTNLIIDMLSYHNLSLPSISLFLRYLLPRVHMISRFANDKSLLEAEGPCHYKNNFLECEHSTISALVGKTKAVIQSKGCTWPSKFLTGISPRFMVVKTSSGLYKFHWKSWKLGKTACHVGTCVLSVLLITKEPPLKYIEQPCYVETCLL